MEGLFDLSLEMLLGLNIILLVLLLIYTIISSFKIKKLRLKYEKFMNGVSEGNLEEILLEYIERLKIIEIKNKEMENRLSNAELNIINCVQKVGVVRFNAFDNVGSDLSFSVALLDDNDDGIVLSGLYSRESSCTYAKPIMSGNSKYALSAEEMKAIDIAKKSGRSFVSLNMLRE
jgi:hypothetical protein